MDTDRLSSEEYASASKLDQEKRWQKMIRVNENYSIIVSGTDYCVTRTTTSKKSGKPVVNYLSYHDSLVGALNRIGTFIARDAVRGQDLSLAEAVERIEDALKDLRLTIALTIPEVKVAKND